MSDGPVSARAFWVTGPGVGELRDCEVPAPRVGEVRVRTLFSGISRGTESLVFRGRVPVSEHERMRAPFQEGGFPYPVKYGYASVGVIEAGPAELEGREVYCLFPHQTRYVVPVESVHVLPDDVPGSRAVLAANLETAVNGLWDAGPRIGDHVAVVGAGAVGCLVAWLASRIPGTSVELVEPDASKAGVASDLGATLVAPSSARGDADLVVHASGSPEGLAVALALAGFEATVLELSWFGDREVPLPLGAAFHARRLTLRSSQVGHVAPTRRARWNHRRRLALALALLADPVLDRLVSGESGFESLPQTMAELADGSRPGVLCHRIRY